jgi:hypothetical protein
VLLPANFTERLCVGVEYALQPHRDERFDAVTALKQYVLTLVMDGSSVMLLGVWRLPSEYGQNFAGSSSMVMTAMAH